MKAKIFLAAALLAAPAMAQKAETAIAPSPGEIVAAASASEWIGIAPDDLLVMDLAPDAKGKPRRVVIQLVPPPFSEAWVANIRTFARAHWWDGLAIVRSQDNYVVQWGDPDAEVADKARALPEDLVPTSANHFEIGDLLPTYLDFALARGGHRKGDSWDYVPQLEGADPYAGRVGLFKGFAFATRYSVDHAATWPVHCYGTVGVGRNMPPDAGSGAELYTVIGHAPRHLDRNIAVVGRVIEGIEHLSTLPRGTGPLGFYETPEERVTISAIRLGNDVSDLPAYQYLSTDGESFARYADARANRRDPFFIVPAGGADICNIPVPVRRAPVE